MLETIADVVQSAQKSMLLMFGCGRPRTSSAEEPRNQGPRSLAMARDRRHAPIMQLSEIVHQCPYCELRFSYMAEVKEHVIHDHCDHAEGFVGVQVTVRAARRPCVLRALSDRPGRRS